MTRRQIEARRRAAILATASVVLAAFCWGLNAVFAKGAFEAGIAPAGAHPATVLAAGLVVAAVAWGILLPSWSWPFDRLAEPEIVLRLLGVGLVGTLFPFLLAINTVRIISAAVAGVAATTEPVLRIGPGVVAPQPGARGAPAHRGRIRGRGGWCWRSSRGAEFGRPSRRQPKATS